MRTVPVIAAVLLLTAASAFAQTATPTKTPPATTIPATTPATTMPAKTTPAMPGKTTMPVSSMNKVNVNTATEAQLATIPGVGPAMAAAMVKARPIKNSADLIKRVKGIGPKNFVSLHLNKLLTY